MNEIRKIRKLSPNEWQIYGAQAKNQKTAVKSASPTPSAQEPAQNEESHTWKSLSCAATLVPDLILTKTTGHLMSIQQQRPVVLWKILEWHGSLAASAQLEESSISSCHCGVVHRSGLPTCSRVPPTPNGQKQLNSQRVATEATSRGLCVLHCLAPITTCGV